MSMLCRSGVAAMRRPVMSSIAASVSASRTASSNSAVAAASIASQRNISTLNKPSLRSSTSCLTIPIRCMSMNIPSQAEAKPIPASAYAADGTIDTDTAHGYGSEDHLFSQARVDSTQTSDPTGRNFTYLTAGAASFMAAGFGRVAVNKFISTLSASADVMAMASLEVDITNIDEGRATTVKWRGKPVFIRHRTAHEIELARKDDTAAMRDHSTDAQRVQRDQWIILIGVCTHLGCVPINAAGDFGGWFCPCHGSHYDTSGRARKGPAPLNLEVPEYKFLTDTKVLLG